MENEYEVDRDAEEASAGESQSESSSLSNSLESGLTVESSRGDADSKKLDECGGWTNEKHNLYLDSLENSFVKQLYSLLGGGGGGKTQRLTRTRGVQSNSHKLTDQFTVLQHGCRHKVSFGNKRAHLETMGTAVQGSLLCREEIKSSGDKGFTRTSMSISSGHGYPAQSTAEASGQNFREEEVEEKGCNSEASRKRRRGAYFDGSSLNDQVVP
ncbi:Cold-regulated protein 28 [Hirschfeldia incana]|nr:Cold-regulated protein 28 [Hirschfeldia incana]